MEQSGQAQFAKKLEAFTQSLSRDEQNLFRLVLARGGETEADFARRHQGSIAARAAKLDATLFNKLMDW